MGFQVRFQGNCRCTAGKGEGEGAHAHTVVLGFLFSGVKGVFLSTSFSCPHDFSYILILPQCPPLWLWSLNLQGLWDWKSIFCHLLGTKQGDRHSLFRDWQSSLVASKGDMREPECCRLCLASLNRNPEEGVITQDVKPYVSNETVREFLLLC